MAINLLCIAGKSLEQDEGLFHALRGIEAAIAGSTWEGLELAKSSRFDAVLVSMPLDESSAAELMEQIRRIQPLTPVVIRDPQGTLADAVRLTKLGAYHFTGGDTSPEELLGVIETAVEYRRSEDLAISAPRSRNPGRSFWSARVRPCSASPS